MSKYTNFIKKMYHKVKGKSHKSKMKVLSNKWKKTKHGRMRLGKRPPTKSILFYKPTKQRAIEQKERKAKEMAKKEREKIMLKLFAGEKLTPKMRNKLRRIDRKYPPLLVP